MRSWPLWILVIAVVSGPWFGVVREPQWARVTWVPFVGFEDRPRDMLVNFLLFVPFGWSFVKGRRALGGLALTAGAAAAVSLAVEVPQLFYRLRDPSATDVVMAIGGALAGSLASQALHGSHARGPARRREAGNGRGQQ
jgi:glycopeptide antibiotics resistance protein